MAQKRPMSSTDISAEEMAQSCLVPRSSISTASDGTSIEKVVSAEQIKQVVNDCMPSVQLDDDVSEVLQELATDFVDRLLDYSSLMATHRHSKTLEVEDVRLSLEKRFSMVVPGFSDEQAKLKEMPQPTDEHLKRMSLKRKTIRKFRQK